MKFFQLRGIKVQKNLHLVLIEKAIFKIELYLLFFEKIRLDLAQMQAYLTKHINNVVILIFASLRIICNIQFIDYIHSNQTNELKTNSP